LTDTAPSVDPRHRVHVGAHAYAGQRIGLLGGSFNPAHDGHLYISREALKRLRLDAVWWLVSPQNPLKPVAGMATFADRLAAARHVADDPRIRVTDIEARIGTRYTADTLAALTRRYPATHFVWMMGADNLVQLPSWRHWSRIVNTVVIAVFARQPYDLSALAGRAAHRFAACRVPAGAAASLADRQPPAWLFMPLRRHPATATHLRTTGQWPIGADSVNISPLDTISLGAKDTQ
jgi:nicotinate-nucleotide adenylyltransferase